MKSAAVFIAALLMLAVTSSLARADPLRLVTLEYPPYQFSTPSGADGIVVRVLDGAFERLGIEYTIAVLPWKRALLSVRTGEADGIFTIYKTKERLTFLDYSRTIIMPQVVSVWTRRGADLGYDGTLDSLAGARLGLVLGVSYGQKFDDARAAGTFNAIEVVPEGSINISKLLNKRIDAIVMNKYGAMHHLNMKGALDQVEELKPEVSSVPSYIAFSRANSLTGLRDRLDVVLADMIETGAYQLIIDDYFRD